MNKIYVGRPLQEMNLDEIEIALGETLIEKGTDIEKFSENITKQHMVYIIKKEQYNRLPKNLKSKYEDRLKDFNEDESLILLDTIEMHKDGSIYQYGEFVGHTE